MTEAQLSNAMDAYGSTVYRLALTRMQNIAHFKVEIFGVPRTSRFPKRHPSDTVP